MAQTAQKRSKKDTANLDAGFAQAKQLVDANRLTEAKKVCEQLLSMYGNTSDVLNLMGVIHYRGGDPSAAIGYYKTLLDADPSNTEALWNLANLLLNLGYREQAVQMYESILIHEPEHFRALKQLNKYYTEDQRWPEVFTTAWKVLRQEPWHDVLWANINTAMQHIPRQMITQEFLAELEELVCNPSNNPLEVLKLALVAICEVYPFFNNAITLIKNESIEALESFPVSDLNLVLDIPLLHTLLRNICIPNALFEKLMILVRKRLLFLTPQEKLQDYYPLLLSLATQCYINEHIYYQSSEEREALAELKNELEHVPLSAKNGFICRLLLLASYMPLCDFTHASSLTALIRNRQDKNLAAFIKVAVDNILEERAIVPTIPAISSIEDSVSHAVQGQYEENPYPRWIDYGDFPSETTAAVLKRLFPFFDRTLVELSDAPEILIAGCGTGKHAVGTAQRFANSKVLAVDLSRASLAYAIRKSREYEYKSIEYRQADILQLGQLDRSFDVVESVGVLHHMRDPMQGWRVLTGLLKPGGLMKIGLYSARAREDVTKIREEIKTRGYGDSIEEIKRFRHDLMQDKDMTVNYPFSNSNDFYSLSECRDLLFHRQEHCTSIPEIRERLDVLGLKFIGFEIGQPAYIRGYIKRFPDDKTLQKLDNWHEYEQEEPDIFFGMYQFWCYKPL